MARKKAKKSEPRFDCIAFVSNAAESFAYMDLRKDKQLRYIKEHAKAHNIHVAAEVVTSGELDFIAHWQVLCAMLKARKADGVIVASMSSLTCRVATAYKLIGQVIEAGGIVYSVDDHGVLDLDLGGFQNE